MARKKAKLRPAMRQPSKARECSILDIGSDMLCAVFAHLDFEVNRHVIPLVCKFAEAVAGPSTIWKDFSIRADARCRSAIGPNMLRWLHKRIAAAQNPQPQRRGALLASLLAFRWVATRGDCLSLLPTFIGRLQHISLSNISPPVHEGHLNAAFKALRSSLEIFTLEVSRQHATGSFRACAFPAAVCGCSRLRSLRLASCMGAFNFGELLAAASWANLCSLTHMHLLNCKVRAFPALDALTALQDAIVQCTSAQGELVPLALPAEVLLPHLTELRLDALAALPVAGPASLVSLMLNRCEFGTTHQLQQLAATLPSLQVLHTVSCPSPSPSVQDAVGGLAQLTQLTLLRLHNCGLTSLPSELSGLRALQRVDLAHNEFATLPPVIGAWQYCTALDLSNNPDLGLRFIGSPPAEDADEDSDEVARMDEVASMLTSLTALVMLGLRDSPHAPDSDAMRAAMRTLVDVQRDLPDLEIQLLDHENPFIWWNSDLVLTLPD